MHLGREGCIQGEPRSQQNFEKGLLPRLPTSGQKNAVPKNEVIGLGLRKRFLENDRDTWHDDKYKLKSWISDGRKRISMDGAQVTGNHMQMRCAGTWGQAGVGGKWASCMHAVGCNLRRHPRP